MSYNDEPDFYDEENSLRKDNINKSNKIKSDPNSTLGYEKQKEEIKVIKKGNKKKNENILDEIEEDKEKLNNSRDFNNDEENDDNEPNFYEQDDSNFYESSNSEEENKNSEKKKTIELKNDNININNIFDINKKFNYNENNPIFYIIVDKKPLDKYPKPLSSNELLKIIQKEKISYSSLKVKLVDLFQFKSKEPYIYVDFNEILKPNWASDVTYSKIFLELSENNINKNKKIDKDKKINNEKKNQKDIFNDDISGIAKIINEQESISFSLFKNKENEKEEKKDKVEDKKEKKENNNKINKNKKKGKKKGEEIEIKTRFIYDD